MSAGTAGLVEAAEGLQELVEAHADKGEQGRRLPKRLVQALRDAQLFRMCVPAAYGGPEADPITMVSAIEKIAIADGAAGWCTMIASTTSSMSLFLEPEIARSIYGDPKIITGGVYAPNGRAVRDGDGWRVTGRWQWGSGSQHSQYKFVSRSIPVSWRFGHHFEQHRACFRRHLSAQYVRIGWFQVEVRVERSRRITGKRHAARQHLISHNAQRILIGRRADFIRTTGISLLGGHVLWRAQ